MATLFSFVDSVDKLIYTVLLTVGGLAAYVAYTLYAAWKAEQPYPGLPLATVDNLSPREAWQKKGFDVIKKGLEDNDGRPFQVMTGTGPVVFLRYKYAEEVKNHPDISHRASTAVDFMVNYHGFDGMRVGILQGDMLRDVLQRKLTTALTAITGDLVDETNLGVQDMLGSPKDWNSIFISDFLTKLIARTSSRTFVGAPLCRDQRYLEIQSDYVVHLMMASHELRKQSPAIRWFKQWSLPNCTALRKDLADAKGLITEELQRREVAARKARAEGKKAPKKADAIAWLIETADEKKYDLKARKVDVVAFQLTLALGAIHTTSQVMAYALIHLCQHPEFFQPMREEIINVLGEKGWERNSLYQLKFMDSFLKESHRVTLHPAGLRRMAMKDITLHDGTFLPKGRRFLVEAPYYDPRIYPDPYKFDPYRFVRKREEPGEDNKWHYVSVQPEFMGFGLGDHACPGRFFAANETKILLAHLVMKFDWSLDPKAPLVFHAMEGVTPVGHDAKLKCKRRQEEIDVDLVKD